MDQVLMGAMGAGFTLMVSLLLFSIAKMFEVSNKLEAHLGEGECDQHGDRDSRITRRVAGRLL